MPASEQTTERLAKEAQVLFGAGTASTARTLDVTVYHILANPHVRNRLTAELATSMADFPAICPPLATLRGLPYLQAVIKEGLRYVKESAGHADLQCSMQSCLWSNASTSTYFPRFAHPI